MASPNVEGSSNATATGSTVFGTVVGGSDGPTTFAGSNVVAASSLADLAALKAYLVTLGLLK